MVSISAKERTQSTLLIPIRLIESFSKKAPDGKRAIYFRYLIKTYSPLIQSGAFGKRENLKLKYQKKEENVIPKNFRPYNEDWAEFQILSNYLGISMTGLFTLLLKLDISDFSEKFCEEKKTIGVPPKIGEIYLFIRIIWSNPSRIFRRIRYKVNSRNW